jgi:hypothetical protein
MQLVIDDRPVEAMIRRLDEPIDRRSGHCTHQIPCAVAATNGIVDYTNWTMTDAGGFGKVRAARIPKELSLVLGPNFPILGRLLSAPVATPVIPVEDDPATLARLAAIMSDRVPHCPRCGSDPLICRAIGCGVDDAPLLLAQGMLDEPRNRDESSAGFDELVASREPELVASR